MCNIGSDTLLTIKLDIYLKKHTHRKFSFVSKAMIKVSSNHKNLLPNIGIKHLGTL